MQDFNSQPSFEDMMKRKSDYYVLRQQHKYEIQSESAELTATNKGNISDEIVRKPLWL